MESRGYVDSLIGGFRTLRMDNGAQVLCKGIHSLYMGKLRLLHSGDPIPVDHAVQQETHTTT